MFKITNTETGTTVELTGSEIGTAWLAVMMYKLQERSTYGAGSTAKYISEIADKLHSVNFN
jgi:hypothetical protein